AGARLCRRASRRRPGTGRHHRAGQDRRRPGGDGGGHLQERPAAVARRDRCRPTGRAGPRGRTRRPGGASAVVRPAARRLRERRTISIERKAMRIAQIAPLTEPCPPRLYGGTERIVSYLTE